MSERLDQAPPEPPSEPEGEERPVTEKSLLDQMGGVSGMAYSAVPVVVFVLANTIFGLTAGIWSALSSAVLITLVRLVRRETLQPAISGFFGVAIASLIAAKTGDAKDYFLFGIYVSLVYCAVFVVSILVRWPLAGVVWNFLNGAGTAWRKDKVSLRAYDIATLAMASVFAARFVVQNWLHGEDQVGWLAVAKIGMGFPLWAMALLVVVWAIRKSDKRLKELAAETEAVTETDAEIEQRLREKYS